MGALQPGNGPRAPVPETSGNGRPKRARNVCSRSWVRIARPLDPRPDNNKLPFGIENDPCSELLTFPIQCLLDPFNVPPRWIGEAKVLDLQWNQSERMEASAGWIQVGEIHQREVVTVALVTTGPFIVVQKITAAIENETISINFDRSRMMRRMPVNDRHACLVDESPGQNLLLIRNVISPIGSPMDRNDDEIARPPERHDLVSGLQRARLAQVRQQVDAWSVGCRSPLERDAARCRSERKDQEPRF